MTAVTLLDPAGVPSARAGVGDEIATQEIKPHLIHETVVAELAAERSGSHSTKTRAEVRGGGRKPWRQKGTGRARQGSIRSPQWVGGGVVFGPTPRSYGGKVNRKVRRQALLGALRAHVERASIAVMEPTGWDAPSTKRAAGYLAAAPERLADRPIAVVVVDIDGIEARSFRNLRDVDVVEAGDVTTAMVMSYRSLLVERAAWESLWGELGASEALDGADYRTAADVQDERLRARRQVRAERMEAKRAKLDARAARRAAAAPVVAEPVPAAEDEDVEDAPADEAPVAEPDVVVEPDVAAESENTPVDEASDDVTDDADEDSDEDRDADEDDGSEAEESTDAPDDGKESA